MEEIELILNNLDSLDQQELNHIGEILCGKLAYQAVIGNPKIVKAEIKGALMDLLSQLQSQVS